MINKCYVAKVKSSCVFIVSRTLWIQAKIHLDYLHKIMLARFTLSYLGILTNYEIRSKYAFKLCQNANMTSSESKLQKCRKITVNIFLIYELTKI